jgi:hypothetical protein
MTPLLTEIIYGNLPNRLFFPYVMVVMRFTLFVQGVNDGGNGKTIAAALHHARKAAVISNAAYAIAQVSINF